MNDASHPGTAGVPPAPPYAAALGEGKLGSNTNAAGGTPAVPGLGLRPWALPGYR